MRFVTLSPLAAYALLTGVALVILLLHLLKPPAPRNVVPSLLLWAKLIHARRRPAARWLMSLLLALAAGLSLALALARPEIPALGATAERYLLILDNSPSMAARTHDGRSRWEHAVEKARALLDHLGAGAEVRLLDTAGQLGGSAFVDRDTALAAIDRVRVVTWENARMPPASLYDGAQAHLFTDGVAQLAPLGNTIVHSVFEAADNVAVTAFEARPLVQDPTRYEALVQVVNASPRDRRVRLLLAGGDQFSLGQDLDLQAGETVNTTFDISEFAGGVLGAIVVCQTDAFDLDDMAYTVIPPHRPKRVLLVTTGNPRLEDALRHVPGTRLSVIGPDDYLRAGTHDAVVMDRFAPAEPPAAGALLLRPPARKWLAGPSTILDRPRITGWNQSHAVTGGIAWRNLRLARASLDTVSNPADALVLASGSSGGALVTASESPVRWVKVGFALEDSNFTLQPDFPVFLGNAVNWLTEPTQVLVRGLGSIEVPLRAGQVRDGSNKPVTASVTTEGVVFEALRPDVYTVSTPGKRIVVVANIPDPSYAQINRTHLHDSDTSVGARIASGPLSNVALWMLLILFAGALLLIEWAAFTRRFMA